MSKTSKLHNAIDYIKDTQKKFAELVIQEDMRYKRLLETSNQVFEAADIAGLVSMKEQGLRESR